jgi:hypothetical protein
MMPTTVANESETVREAGDADEEAEMTTGVTNVRLTDLRTSDPGQR